MKIIFAFGIFLVSANSLYSQVKNTGDFNYFYGWIGRSDAKTGAYDTTWHKDFRRNDHFIYHREFHFTDTNKLETVIDILMDSVFVYRQLDHEYQFTQGELVLTEKPVSYGEFGITDENGDDIPGTNGQYGFLPHGQWRIRYQEFTEEGTFDHGVRTGEWFQFSNHYFIEPFCSIRYEKGIAVDTVLRSVTVSESNLSGKWFLESRQNYSESKSYLASYLVLTPTSSGKGVMYDLKKDYTVRELCLTGCGTGSYCGEENYKWKLNKQNQLILGNTTYTIDYLSENYLVLKQTNSK